MRFLALALLLAGSASAQDVTLYPGHPDLDTAALTPADVTQDVRMVEPQDQSIGLSVETSRLEGDVLTVVTRTEAGASRVDSTRVRWPSLAPLSYSVELGDGRGEASFSGTDITGVYGAEGSAQAFELALPSVPFPMAVLPYVVRALPLDQTGYEATAPVFSPRDRLKDVYLMVEGSETVTLADGSTVETVAVSQTGGPMGAQRHFVDPATREIVQTEIRQQGMVIRATPVTADELAALQAQDEAARAAAEATRAAAAENRISPGSDALVAVAPQPTTYAVMLTQPAQQRLGTITVSETLADGRLTIATDVQIPAAGQNQQDTTVVAYPSLKPISRVEVTPAGTERATFADGQMVGTFTEDDRTIEVQADLGSAFGPGVTRLIIRSLPFAEGYATSFVAVDGEGERSTSFLTVTGQDTYTRPDGTEAMVWVVVDSDGASPDTTYHVDAETREIVKMAFAPQPGVAIEMVKE